MNDTLPLFEELEPAAGDGVGAAPERSARRSGFSDRHLRAAWRLSRGMWRYPEHSPQQTRAGLAICEHLKALLAESDHEVRSRSADFRC